MISLLVAFFTSFILSILIIRTQNMHGSLSGDLDLNGPQKFHTTSVPRIGGLAIGLGLLSAIAANRLNNSQGNENFLLLSCALPAFGIGITEDITKNISVRMRLLCTAIGAYLACLFLELQITRLDVYGIDLILTFSFLSIFFTVFAITGLANAYNIIDGFNGLSSMVGIITLLALGYMGLKFGDLTIAMLSFGMASAILGFFLLNYPRGLIFLGDGGAYLIGFWVAVLTVLLVKKHPQISPWFALMINAYPIMETLFTIYRRKFHQGKSPGHPDGIHFHSLIFRRVLNRSKITSSQDLFYANSRTSPYLWILASLAIIPAVLFFNSTLPLIGFFLLFFVTYVWLYKRIVTFKTPLWLHP